MKTLIEIKGGTQRSWDREVGYGLAPDWYFESQTVELDIPDVDISQLMENYENKLT